MFESKTTNSIVLITGASSGIGEAFAEVFSEQNHDLILIARNKRKLYEIRNKLETKYQNNVWVIAADLTEEKSFHFICQQIKDWQLEVDILVNNAGMGDWGYFKDCKWDKQEKMILLNMAALTHLTRLFLPLMVERGSGKILNVASTAAFQPGPLMSVYFATKAYVLSFPQALSNEVKDKGVTITCVCPGPTDSRFQEAASIKDIYLETRLEMSDPLVVAQYGFQSMMKGKLVAIPGNRNKVFALAGKILPVWLVLIIVHYMQGLYK